LKVLLIACFLIISNFLCLNRAQAELDPKVKVVATMAAYGTAGGALLGFASMAFKSNGRAIFQGASLGLWAGLIFGGYVVISHSIRQSRGTSYPSGDDTEESQYPEDDQGPYQGSYNQSADRGGYAYNPYWIKHEFKLSNNLLNHKENLKAQLSRVYLDVVQITF